jgi:hypothetical protein
MAKTKLPYIKLYPGDWIRDEVSGCSLAAQGLWFRMMIIAHDSEPYGFLAVNGIAMTSEHIARRCGCTLHDYDTYFGELKQAGVPSFTAKTNIIYSRRMVRDGAKRDRPDNESMQIDADRCRSEGDRVDADNQRIDVDNSGANNREPSGNSLNSEIDASMRSGSDQYSLPIDARSIAKITEHESVHDVKTLNVGGVGGAEKLTTLELSNQSAKIYAAYPRKVARPAAIRAIEKKIRIHGFDVLFRSTQLFAESWSGVNRDELEWCPHPATWFNQDRFNDDPSTWKKRVKKECSGSAQAFISQWCEKYEKRFGTKYVVTVVDESAAEKVINSGNTPDIMFTLIDMAWAQTDDFKFKKCVTKSGTISGFYEDLNTITKELYHARNGHKTSIGNRGGASQPFKREVGVCEGVTDYAELGRRKRAEAEARMAEAMASNDPNPPASGSCG